MVFFMYIDTFMFLAFVDRPVFALEWITVWSIITIITLTAIRNHYFTNISTNWI